MWDTPGMNGFRLLRLVVAVAFAALAIVSFVQGEFVTALLEMVLAVLAAVLSVGMRDEDALEGWSWRTARPWGKGIADGFLVVVLALNLLPIGLRAIA